MTRPIFALDCECNFSTREGVTIDSLGNFNYLRKSPPHTLAVVGEDFEWVGNPEKFDFEQLPKDALLVAHNMAFDSCWFAVQGIKPPREINCTANMAAYLQFPRSLENAVWSIFKVAVDKDIRKRQNGIKFETLSRTDQQEYRNYCLNDARYSLALALEKLDSFPEHEQRLSQHTTRMGEQGVPVNADRIDEFHAKLEEIAGRARKKIPWIENGGSPLSLQQARNECEECNIPAPKSFEAKSEEFQAWVEKFGSRVPFVQTMSDYRMANRLLQILDRMKARIMPDGRMNFSLYFCGSHTGRWAGCGGLNMQNMDKRPFHGIALRNVIEASAGKKLIVTDFSQVEARVLQWLVGNEKLMEALRQGFSIYEAYARQNNFWKGSGKLKENDSTLYHLVKAMVLGLGYGAGAERFRGMAKSQYNIPLTLDEAARLVEEFREYNPKVVRYWRKLIGIFENAINQGETEHTLRLRSGRPLIYRALHYEDGTLAGKCGARPWQEHLWGGLICENVISGMARDLLGHSILNLDKAGVRVILHTHDELLLEVDADADMKEIEEIIVRTPEWAKGFPLAVESFETRMYEKR